MQSMMAAVDPLIAADPDCLVAVSQHGFARDIEVRQEYPGVWLPTSELPPHVAAGDFPSWADCPTLLWDTPLPDRSDAKAAEAACVAISIKFRAMLGTVVPDNGGLMIEWDTDTCIGSLWPEGTSKCAVYSAERHPHCLLARGHEQMRLRVQNVSSCALHR